MRTSTLGKALSFIERVQTDKVFRKSLYAYETLDELSDYLDTEGLYCSHDDFENGTNKKKVEAPTILEADEIDEIDNWWKILLSTLSGEE